jgi:acyl dehydratase
MKDATTPARVERDAKARRATYDEIEVGASLGEMDWAVTEKMIEQQCRMDLDYDEFYSLDSPWGGRIAPPQIQYRPPRWLLSRTYNVRGLFYRWKMENIRPIRLNETLHIRSSIVDKYVRNDREFVVFAAEATNAQGDVVFRTERTHALDILDRTAPRTGEGLDSGIKAEKL